MRSFILFFTIGLAVLAAGPAALALALDLLTILLERIIASAPDF